jgi:hypothetical protein
LSWQNCFMSLNMFIIFYITFCEVFLTSAQSNPFKL